jgi:hypothetical protein
MDDYDEPNILFFRGISPEKYDIDTMWTSRLLESIDEDDCEISAVELANEYATQDFDKIPEYFETLDQWPKRINIRCGSCSRNFKTRPAAVVTNVHNVGTQFATKMRTPIITCSFDCSVHFINVRFKGDRREWEEMHRMLRQLYFRMTGVLAVELHEAPDMLDMVQWGGRLTVDSFIKQLHHILPECAPSL